MTRTTSPFFLLIFLLIIPSCAEFTKLHVKQTQDQFEGTRTVQMDGNVVKIDGAAENTAIKTGLSILNGGFALSTMATELNLEQHIQPDSADQLSVIASISIREDGQFFIDDGESLVFLVDGNRIGLSTQGEFGAQRGASRTRSSSSNARYAITKEQIKAIIDGNEVKFRIVNGGYMERTEEVRDKKDNFIEGSFTEKNKQAWRDFYSNHIQK